MKTFRAALLAAVASVGCGLSEKEHNDLVKAAVDERQARCDEEMKKIHTAHEETVGSKDQMITGLESEVRKMGGDLARVRTALGDRVTELASTKTELAATSAELEQLRRLREQAEREAAQFRALAQRLKSMVDAGQLEVVMRNGRINLKLPDAVLFPSGSKSLKRGGRQALKEVAAVLRDVPDREFLIAGHTDNIPVKRGGRFRTNWELSTARAVEVTMLLIKEGVAPEALAAAGFGEYDPIASNDTREERQKNRRLEIILLPKIEQIAL